MSSVQPGPANAYASIVPTPALSAGPAFPLQSPLAHDEGFLFFLGTSLIWRSVAEEEVHPSADATSSRSACGKPTGRQGLLELLGLVRVLEDQGVEEPLAADLELDLLGVLVLLDPGGCAKKNHCQNLAAPIPRSIGHFVWNVQEASFRRQISMN